MKPRNNLKSLRLSSGAERNAAPAGAAASSPGFGRPIFVATGN
jgi:hypothetical protein